MVPAILGCVPAGPDLLATAHAMLPDVVTLRRTVPGTIVFLGARPAELDPVTAPQNHSNRVVFDEPPMALGAAMYAAVALRHHAR